MESQKLQSKDKTTTWRHTFLFALPFVDSGSALTSNLVFVTKAQVGGNPSADYADSGRRAGRNRIGLGLALRPNLKNA